MTTFATVPVRLQIEKRPRRRDIRPRPRRLLFQILEPRRMLSRGSILDPYLEPGSASAPGDLEPDKGHFSAALAGTLEHPEQVRVTEYNVLTGETRVLDLADTQQAVVDLVKLDAQATVDGFGGVAGLLSASPENGSGALIGEWVTDFEASTR